MQPKGEGLAARQFDPDLCFCLSRVQDLAVVCMGSVPRAVCKGIWLGGRRHKCQHMLDGGIAGGGAKLEEVSGQR